MRFLSIAIVCVLFGCGGVDEADVVRAPEKSATYTDPCANVAVISTGPEMLEAAHRLYVDVVPVVGSPLADVPWELLTIDEQKPWMGALENFITHSQSACVVTW